MDNLPPLGGKEVGVALAATEAIARLAQVNWEFRAERTQYLTHGIHPYPAKFIPQIPRAIIEELSQVGDVVLDIFCGSGTTLLEALLLRRHSIGIDANPLACLISRAKTAILSPPQFSILQDHSAAVTANLDFQTNSQLSFFGRDSLKHVQEHEDTFKFWFDPEVIRELAAIKAAISTIADPTCIDVANCAFSSIVVAVSKQDSDTRYVRRDKGIKPGETTARYLRSLSNAVAALKELAAVGDSTYASQVIQADIRGYADLPGADLVVCSPPYPNAYSYHLYHMTRMLWLGMDQPAFKVAEIGSHRKYSSKSKTAANVETFRSEVEEIFGTLRHSINANGFAVFVVGDSTIRGERISNDRLLVAAAQKSGFHHEITLSRRLNERKKSFNPSHGRIKEEKIVILRRT